MNDPHLALVKEVHRNAIEQQHSAMPAESLNEKTIPYTELPSLPLDCEYHHEWNTYRRNVARLLANGLEGTWVLVKGDNILAAFPAWKTAYLAGLAMIAEKEIRHPFLLHQVRSNESASRLEEYRRQCPNLHLPLAKTA